MEDFLKNIDWKYAVIYLIVINIVGFLAMGIDKWKAKHDMWRTPEDSLFLLTALGGGFGTIAGMYTFRHKTKKPKFTIGMPAILVLETILVIYLLVKSK